eukprot:60286-Amphidinium_carterae.1
MLSEVAKHVLESSRHSKNCQWDISKTALQQTLHAHGVPAMLTRMPERISTFYPGRTTRFIAFNKNRCQHFDGLSNVQPFAQTVAVYKQFREKRDAYKQQDVHVSRRVRM